MVAPPRAAPDRQPFELIVAAEEAGERLDRMLSARDLGYSRSALQAFIAEGRVLVNGNPARASARLQAGATIAVRPAPQPPSAAIAQDLPLELLYQDDHLAVLMKPAGLVVHPAPGHPDGTLVNALRFHLQVRAGDPERPGIVHRLDRGTSGVMVVARTDAAREGLIASFQRHDIDREYVAIACGEAPLSARFDTLHGRHPYDRKRFSGKVTNGKRAITEIEVIERLYRATLIRCRLETGRTHQIRMHLSEHGFPILADALYGRTPNDVRLRHAATAIGHQALHARILGFTHPITAERLTFNAPPPPEFEAAVSLLRN